MNKTIVLTAILVPFLVIGLIFTVGCGEPEPTEKPDIPRYTADQVIAVAQANSPVFPSQYPQCDKASWTAEYLGQGVWVVKKYCIDRQGFNRGLFESWYFHEDNGQLNKSRY